MASEHGEGQGQTKKRKRNTSNAKIFTPAMELALMTAYLNNSATLRLSSKDSSCVKKLKKDAWKRITDSVNRYSP